MNNQQLKGPDSERSYLRLVATAVDCEMSRLKPVMTGETHVIIDRLIENWEEPAALLALGPEPEYRECPFCGNIGMLLATRCGSCWKKRPPLISQSEA